MITRQDTSFAFVSLNSIKHRILPARTLFPWLYSAVCVSRWCFLLVKMQRAADRTGPGSDLLRENTKRLTLVLGQRRYSWDIFTPAGREQSKSSTRCLMVKLMSVEWLTTRAWIGTPWRPSSADPLGSTSDGSASPLEQHSSSDCTSAEPAGSDKPCSSNICLKRTLKNFLILSFTWK